MMRWHRMTRPNHHGRRFAQQQQKHGLKNRESAERAATMIRNAIHEMRLVVAGLPASTNLHAGCLFFYFSVQQTHTHEYEMNMHFAYALCLMGNRVGRSWFESSRCVELFAWTVRLICMYMFVVAVVVSCVQFGPKTFIMKSQYIPCDRPPLFSSSSPRIQFIIKVGAYTHTYKHMPHKLSTSPAPSMCWICLPYDVVEMHKTWWDAGPPRCWWSSGSSGQL